MISQVLLGSTGVDESRIGLNLPRHATNGRQVGLELGEFVFIVVPNYIQDQSAVLVHNDELGGSPI